MRKVGQYHVDISQRYTAQGQGASQTYLDLETCRNAQVLEDLPRYYGTDEGGQTERHIEATVDMRCSLR